MWNLQTLENVRVNYKPCFGNWAMYYRYNELENMYFSFWHCNFRCGNCKDWKMENKNRSCARALIETSTWKSKIDTFYLCCKIHQDEKSHCWHWCKEVVTLMQIQHLLVKPKSMNCVLWGNSFLMQFQSDLLISTKTVVSPI